MYFGFVEAVVQLLKRASERRRVCRIILRGEPLARVVHPYGVCRTSRNRVVLVCWQALGFTKAGGKEGYRNLLLADIMEVEILDVGFAVDPGFNPADGLYREWVYHIRG